MKLVASAQTPLEVFLHVRMTTLIELKVLLKAKPSFSSFSKDQDKKSMEYTLSNQYNCQIVQI